MTDQAPEQELEALPSQPSRLSGVHLLPDTLLSLVFDFLSAGSSAPLSRVSKEWQACARMPWLWRSYFMARWPATLLSSLDADTPGADSSHLLSDECAGEVEWRAAFASRARIATWSASLFTPPRRRPQPGIAASAAASSAAQSSSGEAASPASASSGRHLTHRNSHGKESGGPAPASAHERHGGTGSGHGARGGGGSNGAGDGSDSSNLPRSRSTSWSEEKHRHSAARRSSLEDRADAAAAALNNHSAPPRREEKQSGNITKTSNPNSRGVRHSPAQASPLQRARAPPVPIPSPHFGTSSPAAIAASNMISHGALPPAFPSPLLSSRLAFGSPGAGGGAGAAGLSSEFEELELGGACVAPDSGASALPMVLTGHRAAVTCLKFDEQRLCVAAGKDVRMYSLRSGQLLEHLSVLKSGLLTSLDFSPGILVTASTDCALRVFDIDSMDLRRVTARKAAHSDVVTAVRLAPNERVMLSASLDASMKVWEVEGGQCVSTLNQGDSARLGMLLAMEPGMDDTSFFCGASSQHQARLGLFDVRMARVAHAVSVAGGAQMLCSLSFSASNCALAVGGNEGSCQIFDVRAMGDSVLRPILVAVPNLSVPVAVLGDTGRSSSRAPSPVAGLNGPAAAPLGEALGAASASPAPLALTLRAPIQSVHLDGARLLVCQKRALSVFSSSVSSPGLSTGLPFAHLVQQVTLDDVARFSRPTCPPALNALHYARYDEQLQTFALATTDAVLVWLKQRHVFDAHSL